MGAMHADWHVAQVLRIAFFLVLYTSFRYRVVRICSSFIGMWSNLKKIGWTTPQLTVFMSLNRHFNQKPNNLRCVFCHCSSILLFHTNPSSFAQLTEYSIDQSNTIWTKQMAVLHSEMSPVFNWFKKFSVAIHSSQQIPTRTQTYTHTH